MATTTKRSRPPPGLAARGDRHLIERVLAGDADARRAFELLVERHRGWVERACQRRLRNRHDAEDAAQEVMIRMYRGLPGYQGRATVKTWLGVIVERECATVAERRSRAVLEPAVGALIRVYEEQTRPPARDPDASRRVLEALLRLPGPARQIVELRFFRELALEEIAVTLELSLSAAKMRLYRALDQLRSDVEAALPAGARAANRAGRA